MNRRILNIAIPSIVSNITVPLLGLVDMAISGHMGDAVYIGAVAVGSMIFNVIYWLFGFLRMGTSGMTSQSLGRRDLDGVAMLLMRSMGVALLIGFTIVVLQYPIGRLALMLTGATADISSEAWVYFRICVWGAPAMLCLYGLTGWYIGMQNTRLPMFISILQNVVNIAASFTFVYVMGMKVEGVALGTLVAQYAGLVVSLALCTYTYGNRLFGRIRWRDIFEQSELSRFFTVNRDIFLRTLFLVMVNLFFTSFGSRQGTLMLSANTLLLTLFTLTSFFLDGLAYAAEALGGKYCGAADRKTFSTLTRRLFLWGIIVAIVFTLVFAFGGKPLLHLLTSEHDVISTALPYLPWAVAIPIAGVTAFLLDGLFIGLTATRPMLWSTALAAIVFFTLYFTLAPTLHNHALWLALIAYLAMRGMVEMLMLRFSPSVFKSFMQ